VVASVLLGHVLTVTVGNESVYVTIYRMCFDTSTNKCGIGKLSFIVIRQLLLLLLLLLSEGQQ
jgi:hypothetical protein